MSGGEPASEARWLIVEAFVGHDRHMFVLVLGMLLSVVLAVAVLFIVAVPARRDGRDVLTPKGEDMVSLVREKTGEALETAREKTGEAFDAARDKVSDVTRSNED
jgi:competence protein ComGC